MPKPVRVFGFDLDQTVVYTFEAPKIGVPSAYQQSITDIWGEKGWEALGGFQNQAPIEIGKKIREGVGERYATQAQAYYSRRKSEIDIVMPANVGATIDFAEGNILNSGVDLLVRRKLELLLPNIGTRHRDGVWPNLTPKLSDFWIKCSDSDDVVTAVISSGHDVFIEKVFQQYYLPQPRVIISDDYMRRKGLRLYKPAATIWEHVLKAVRDLNMLPVDSHYFGDSREHDGGLARNAGINFHHFADEDSVWHGHEGSFSNWNEMMDLIP